MATNNQYEFTKHKIVKAPLAVSAAHFPVPP